MNPKRFVPFLLVLLLLASSQAFAAMKQYTNDEFGLKIGLPDRWLSQPIPPKTDYDSLGMSGWLAELLDDDRIIPLFIFKGPQDCEFRLFSLKVENMEKALEVAQSYAEMCQLGKALKVTDFKVTCGKTKVKTMRYTSTGRPADGWDDGTFAHHYFVAQNENGYYFYFYVYFVQYKKYEAEIMDSAKSFAFSKKKEVKKDADSRKQLPPGWSVLETENYLIQYNEPDATKVKNFGARIEKLHAAHVKVVPPDKEMEKIRPAVSKHKFAIKYFKDKAGFDGYAADNAVWGAAAWYSPGQGEIVFYLTGWSKETLAILYHECTHQYLQDLVGGPKIRFHTWINEGLAEYFFAAGMEETDKIIIGAIHKDARNTVKNQIRSGEEIPVAKLIDMPKSEYYRIGRRAYDYGWSVVHFLLNAKNKEYNAVIPNYFYELQAIVFPVLNEMDRLGIKLSDSLFDWIDEGETKPPKGDDDDDLGDDDDDDDDDDMKKVDEELEKAKKREEFREILKNAAANAQKKAFGQINMEQLQKDWTDFYK